MSAIKAETKLAMELEQKGYDFYSQTAKKTDNPLAVSVLGSLADREKVHMQRIMEFYQNLTGEKILQNDWLAKVEVPPTKKELLTTIVAKLKTSLDRKFESKEDIVDAYKIAEGLERDSYTLYDKIASEYEDPTTKKFFLALAEEEKEHYAILDDTLIYLNDPGEWFRRQERWIVEG